MVTRHDRKDFHLGRFHLIWRGYNDAPQYGFLAWSVSRRWTVDFWIHQRLLTIRRCEW